MMDDAVFASRHHGQVAAVGRTFEAVAHLARQGLAGRLVAVVMGQDVRRGQGPCPEYKAFSFNDFIIAAEVLRSLFLVKSQRRHALQIFTLRSPVFLRLSDKIIVGFFVFEAISEPSAK